MTLSVSNRKSLGAAAYEQICRNIVTLAYRPGAVLDEKGVMADLGLGRTPVREALLRLAGEGWIDIQPNRGAVVPPITLQDTRAVFEAMKFLEAGVAGLAAGQNIERELEGLSAAADRVAETVRSGDIPSLVDANHEFHVWYARCSKNDFIIRACIDARNHAKRLSYLSYASDMEMSRPLDRHYESVVREHASIIACLREKEENRLKEIVVHHIASFQQRIISYLSS